MSTTFTINISGKEYPFLNLDCDSLKQSGKRRVKGTTPAYIEANGLWFSLTGRKKYRITCGKCYHVYTDKVVFTSGEKASSFCPACKTENIWSHKRFSEAYERRVEN